MSFRKTLTLVLSLLLGALTLSGQIKVTVTGVVLDEESLPLSGAVVTVPSNPGLGGAITDASGAFMFEIPAGSTIQISLMGFAPWEQTITDPTNIIVSLEAETEQLEDAVVVAYGTQSKESVVGSISQVKGDELTLSGTSNLTNALAGKVAGMNHYSTNGSGAPGEQDFAFTIRGLSSWNGNNPLVMVDGVERSLLRLSPNEIASISVLKDASATAVYGAKGANGVILVTTKTGQKGKAKFNINLEYGLEQPWRIPDHVDALTTSLMVNTGYRNQGSFGSLYSSRELQYYADGTNPLRYPDVNWYDVLFKDFTTSYTIHANVSGGSDKIKYYFGANYTHQGSIVKGLYETQNSAYSNESFGQDKYNYRFNMDFSPTKTTSFALKLGGTLTNTRSITEGGSSHFTGVIYQSPTTLYPAYYPAWALELYPDPDYPDAEGIRLGNNQGAYYANPYAYIAHPDFKITQRSVFSADFFADQKLDFITKGLQIGAKVSLTTGFNRIAAEVNKGLQKWDILWDLVDSGADNPWYTPTASNYVWTETPYTISQTNTASSIQYNFYLEGSLRYKRKFANKHNVSALALYSQREVDDNASFPHRNQSLVGRITYDYKSKYLLEGNVGYTGSEQFSPKHRFGLFPSVAFGWRISEESFFRQALPWWSTMKVRYSIGKVGSDSASAEWLYYTYWGKNPRTNQYYIEGAAANEDARWETALKQDLGLEFGWLNDDLTLNVDLYKEHRYDMLVSPVVTAFVSVSFKDINAGELKKHGIDVELRYRHSWKKHWHINASLLAGWNENRILAYEEAAYTPNYQKFTGTAYGAARTGATMVDDKYFKTIDEIHGYPTYTTSWLGNVVPGVFKYVDFCPDGIIEMRDAHTVKGTRYPPFTGSFTIGGGYKGLRVNMLFQGVLGKYYLFRRSATVPFLQGENVVHSTYVDYWSPLNQNPAAPVLLFSDLMYSWAGGTAISPGYDIQVLDYTWRNSDYFRMQELMLSYTFDSDKGLLHKAGIGSLTVMLTGNNLFTLTSLPDFEPVSTNATTMYYPVMRVFKLGVQANF